MKTNDSNFAGLYYLAYSIYLFSAITLASTARKPYVAETFSALFGVAVLICGILVMIRALLLRFDLRRVVLLIALMPVMLISWHRSGIYSLVVILVFVLGGQGIVFRRVVRSTLITLPLAFICVQLLVLLGLTSNIEVYRLDSHIIRPSLGFMHPNTLGMLCVNFAMAWSYYFWHARGFRYRLIPITLLIFVSAVLDSRASMLLLSFLVLLWLIDTFRTPHSSTSRAANRTTMKWSGFIVTCIAMLPFAAVAWYDQRNDLATSVDALLSGRLSLAKSYVDFYGYSILGQEVQLGAIDDPGLLHYLDGTRATVDSGILFLALTAGLVPLALLILGALNTVKYASSIQDFPLSACLLTWTLAGLFETSFFSLQYSVPIMSIGLALSQRLETRESVAQGLPHRTTSKPAGSGVHC